MDIKKEERTSFTEQLYSSDLAEKLVTLAKPIVAKHMKLCLADKTLKYEELGNAYEQRIKQALEVFGNLGIVVSDLEKVITFLELDKNRIVETYSNLEIEEYYNYHLENYVIRLNTIPDILAQLGNIICQWGISDKHCYGTSISSNDKITDNDIKNNFSLLCTEISSIRSIRNKKVHTGKAEIDYLGKALCWEIFPKLGIPLDPIIEEYAKEQKNEAVQNICDEINTVLKIIVDILNQYNSCL